MKKAEQGDWMDGRNTYFAFPQILSIEGLDGRIKFKGIVLSRKQGLRIYTISPQEWDLHCAVLPVDVHELLERTG